MKQKIRICFCFILTFFKLVLSTEVVTVSEDTLERHFRGIADHQDHILINKVNFVNSKSDKLPENVKERRNFKLKDEEAEEEPNPTYMETDVTGEFEPIDLLTRKELKDLKNIVKELKSIEFHNGSYDPLANQNRRKRESDPVAPLTKYLNNMIDQLEKMQSEKNAKKKQSFLKEALANLDLYQNEVLNRVKNATKSALQLVILDDPHLLLVQCAGWLWFPVYKVEKVITCENEIMKFENRGSRPARVCDDYVCQDIHM